MEPRNRIFVYSDRMQTAAYYIIEKKLDPTVFVAISNSKLLRGVKNPQVIAVGHWQKRNAPWEEYISVQEMVRMREGYFAYDNTY